MTCAFCSITYSEKWWLRSEVICWLLKGCIWHTEFSWSEINWEHLKIEGFHIWFWISGSSLEIGGYDTTKLAFLYITNGREVVYRGELVRLIQHFTSLLYCSDWPHHRSIYGFLFPSSSFLFPSPFLPCTPTGPLSLPLVLFWQLAHLIYFQTWIIFIYLRVKKKNYGQSTFFRSPKKKYSRT